MRVRFNAVMMLFISIINGVCLYELNLNLMKFFAYIIQKLLM